MCVVLRYVFIVVFNLKAIETPLHFACKYGYTDIVRLLLNHPEIDKSGRNSAGLTAREIICQNNRQNSVAKSIDDLFEGLYCMEAYLMCGMHLCVYCRSVLCASVSVC